LIVGNSPISGGLVFLGFVSLCGGYIVL